MKLHLLCFFAYCICSTVSLSGFAGRGYNDFTNVYQWDTGKFGSVEVLNTDNADGFPAGSPKINGKNAQSIVQGFDTRHRSPNRKNDTIVAVEIGFPDIVLSFHSFQVFVGDHLGVTPISVVGRRVTIGIWPGTVKAGDQRRDNAIYLQDYVVQQEDVGFFPNFTRSCSPGYQYFCNQGKVIVGNGSNIRPPIFDPQGSGDHTRRVQPFVDQGTGEDGKNPFSEYPINFTTIRLNKPVKVHKEFWVGVLANLPASLVPEQPGDDFQLALVGVSVANVNSNQPLPNGISYKGLGLENNEVVVNPNLQPIANGFSLITATSPGSISGFEDDFYAIRAIPGHRKRHKEEPACGCEFDSH